MPDPVTLSACYSIEFENSTVEEFISIQKRHDLSGLVMYQPNLYIKADRRIHLMLLTVCAGLRSSATVIGFTGPCWAHPLLLLQRSKVTDVRQYSSFTLSSGALTDEVVRRPVKPRSFLWQAIRTNWHSSSG